MCIVTSLPSEKVHSARVESALLSATSSVASSEESVSVLLLLSVRSISCVDEGENGRAQLLETDGQSETLLYSLLFGALPARIDRSSLHRVLVRFAFSHNFHKNTNFFPFCVLAETPSLIHTEST